MSTTCVRFVKINARGLIQYPWKSEGRTPFGNIFWRCACSHISIIWIWSSMLRSSCCDRVESSFIQWCTWIISLFPRQRNSRMSETPISMAPSNRHSMIPEEASPWAVRPARGRIRYLYGTFGSSFPVNRNTIKYKNNDSKLRLRHNRVNRIGIRIIRANAPKIGYCQASKLCEIKALYIVKLILQNGEKRYIAVCSQKDACYWILKNDVAQFYVVLFRVFYIIRCSPYSIVEKALARCRSVSVSIGCIQSWTIFWKMYHIHWVRRTRAYYCELFCIHQTRMVCLGWNQHSVQVYWIYMMTLFFHTVETLRTHERFWSISMKLSP